MKVILKRHSVGADPSNSIASFVLEYPRKIHSEYMTHRALSRNGASSRAIPTSAMIAELRKNPAQVVYWGKNTSGMQAHEELTGWRLWCAKKANRIGMEVAILKARINQFLKVHKQEANRCLEPYQNIRIVTTATNWNNFMALRDHPAAQPEFKKLASLMKLALDNSTPTVLKPGEWHLVYVNFFRDAEGNQVFYVDRMAAGRPYRDILTLAQALKIDASMAAQESYRKSNSTLKKAEFIWKKLVWEMPVHASPTEHQAMAMEDVKSIHDSWESGITHMDKEDNYWSGNFRGWIQHRQLIPNHDVKN